MKAAILALLEKAIAAITTLATMSPVRNPYMCYRPSKGCSRRALARRRYILRRTKLGEKGGFRMNRGLNTRLWLYN